MVSRTKAVLPPLQAVRAPRRSEWVPHPGGPPPLFPEKIKQMYIFTLLSNYLIFSPKDQKHVYIRLFYAGRWYYGMADGGSVSNASIAAWERPGAVVWNSGMSAWVGHSSRCRSMAGRQGARLWGDSINLSLAITVLALQR